MRLPCTRRDPSPKQQSRAVVNSRAGDGLNIVPTSDAGVSTSIHIKMILPLRAASTNQTAKSTCRLLRVVALCRPAAPSDPITASSQLLIIGLRTSSWLQCMLLPFFFVNVNKTKKQTRKSLELTPNTQQLNLNTTHFCGSA